ncbi:hypothetical protein LIER_28630 [Lithospermum erythrorhizon]|uniref:Mitochondrial protein n=1 Tax=Lithospermum erythrorhizon TaxID=34254 RepID=A0AAV3RHH1_LITER
MEWQTAALSRLHLWQKFLQQNLILLWHPHSYRCLVRALQYLAFTRPDITSVVNQASQTMHNPSDIDMTAAKRIMRYLAGTPSLGICLQPASSLTLTVYSDSDWARCQVTRRSTIGFFVMLRGNIVSWSSKKQPTVSRSSTEAEYRALATAAAEPIQPTILFCTQGLNTLLLIIILKEKSQVSCFGFLSLPSKTGSA